VAARLKLDCGQTTASQVALTAGFSHNDGTIPYRVMVAYREYTIKKMLEGWKIPTEIYTKSECYRSGEGYNGCYVVVK
jgi:hypothetical protein